MKKVSFVLVLLLSVTAAYSLDAPTLISAEAQSASSIMLSWRNNSTEYTGILVLRKMEGGDGFGVVAETAGNVAEYLDTGLVDGALYSYALIAVAGADSSDTSNVVEVVKRCEEKLENNVGDEQIIPLHPVYTWEKDTKRIVLHYTDDVCDEQGVIITRDDGDSVFRVLDTIFHDDPFDTGYTWIDTNCAPNHLYSYKLSLFKDTLVWTEKFGHGVFTYDREELFITDRFRIGTVDKLGEIPVYYADSGFWAMKNGDTLLVKEANTDSTIYTRIDVGDPEHPVFIDYKHNGPDIVSTSLCFVDNRNIFIYSGSGDDGLLEYYTYNDGEFEKKDTLAGKAGVVIGKLNDSTLITGCDYMQKIMITDSGFSGRSTPREFVRKTIHDATIKILLLIDGILFYSVESTYPARDTSFSVEFFSDYRDQPVGTAGEFLPINFQALPPMIGDFITTDSTLINARHVLLDTAQQHAYLFDHDDVMRIYSYRLDEATVDDLPSVAIHGRSVSGNKHPMKSPVGISSYRTLTYPVTAAIYDISGRVVYSGAVGNVTVFNNVADRLRPGIYAVKAVTKSGKKELFTLHKLQP